MNLRLPAGFVDADTGRFRVIAPRLSLEEMSALLRGRERDALPPAPGGRGGTRRITLPGGKVVYCRKYLRGGCMRHFNSDLFLLRPERPFRELVVTEAARAAGCSVPAVLACAIEEAGPFYRGWIVTEAVAHARPLIEVLGESSAAGRGPLLDAVRAEIDKLHAAGIDHVDLTGQNVLIVPPARPVIIDFDRATCGTPVSARRRAGGLARLRRSLAKLSAAKGLALEASEWRRLGGTAPR